MFVSALVAFCALSPVFAGSHHHISGRHHAVAKRATSELSKRFSNARFTWYDVGLGACGQTNVPSDFIVALNSAQYGGGYPGPNCFKRITITANGKTTGAVIMDECPGCPYGGLDMSKGLFQFFAPLGTGVLTGEWSFDDGSGGSGGGGGGGDSNPPPQTTKKQPTSTSTYHWTPPTTTSTRKTTSSTEWTSTTEHSTTTTHSTTSTSSTRTSTSTTTSTSTSATPTSTPVNDNDAIQALNKAYADLNNMVVIAASS